MDRIFGTTGLGQRRPAWKPYLGQPTIQAPMMVAPVPAKGFSQERLVNYGKFAATTAAIGAVVGLALNLIVPSARIPRKDAWKMAGVSAGISALGMTLGSLYGENLFYNGLAGVGAVLAGNAVADVIVPAPKSILDLLPKMV